MANIGCIKLVYEHCGLEAAIEVAIKFVAIDIVSIMAFAGYCLTLPLQFLTILWRTRLKDRL